jgi:hypothetical protein
VGSLFTEDIDAMMTIRIHHFFDIIRDLKAGGKIMPDLNYKHSYHRVANILRDSADIKIKITVGIDSVCDGCIHNIDGKCGDPLTRKTGFTMKHDYNNWLDKRILEKLKWSEGKLVTPAKICRSADKYIDSIYDIYELDSKEYIDIRKKEFLDGLKFYSTNNNFKLKYLTKYNT